MNVETIKGTVEEITKYGVIIDGTEYKYSKYFKGERFDDSHVGTEVTIHVDHHAKGEYIVDPKDAKPAKAPRPGPAPAPRRSTLPEEGVRIARSVAFDKAISIVHHGLDWSKVKAVAKQIESCILTGDSGATETPKEAKPKRVASNLVNAFYEEALKKGWKICDIEDAAKSRFQTSPYQLDEDQFASFSHLIRNVLKPAA